MDLYTPLIRTWLQRHAVHLADVDDLVQEVMSVVVRELPRFEHNQHRGAFRRWLRTITVHRLRTFWQARQSRPVATGDSAFLEILDQLEDPASQLSRVWDQEHDRHVLRRLLAYLQPEFHARTWQAFRRVVLDGCKASAVAEELQMSVNAVLVAKSRVLQRLRQEGQGLID